MEEMVTKQGDKNGGTNKNSVSLDLKIRTEMPNTIVKEILDELHSACEERTRMEEGINGINTTMNNMMSEVEVLLVSLQPAVKALRPG